MKFNKKSVIVFALCWAIGLVGGYYIGVESALIPNDTIEYGYYFSESIEATDVETVDSDDSGDKKSDCAEDKEDSRFTSFIKNLHLEMIPKRIFANVLSSKS